MYQEHLTIFVKLQPLKRNTAEDITYYVLTIFVMFVLAAILLYDIGSEISTDVVFDLFSEWKDAKLVRGRLHHNLT